MDFIKAACSARSRQPLLPAVTVSDSLFDRDERKSKVADNSTTNAPTFGAVKHAEPISCFSCGHYDGKGSAWPGMCRYFETIGQAAKEIDTEKVNPDSGCKFFEPGLGSMKNMCPLCGGDLEFEGLDNCWHRAYELK